MSKQLMKYFVMFLLKLTNYYAYKIFIMVILYNFSIKELDVAKNVMGRADKTLNNVKNAKVKVA
jgi:hypothetical protein